MAQHDYNIANASFPTVRSDINDVLSAINSSNSGSSRPSSAVAGTIWLDTSGAATAQLLKLYDGAADITLATVNFTANTVDFTDSSVTLALDDVAAGDAAVNLTTTSGNITIDAQGSDTDIIFKGTDDSSDITALTLDMSDAGKATFNSTITADSKDVILGKNSGTNFTDSILVGHSTTGTLDNAINNTGVGIEVLDALTSGDNNVGVGKRSLTTLTTGGNNVAVGYEAGSLAQSSIGGTFLGFQAGSNTTGHRNICIGHESGENLTSGSGNIIIGCDVDLASNTGSRQLKIAGNDGSTTTTWIEGSSAGVLSFNAANVTQQALTSSSNAVAWDASAKPNAVHITTENTTFAAPTNNVEGAFIALEINYNGSHTIAFNTVFEFAASTAPTFTSSDGKTDILVFRYNGAVWQEVGRTLNLSES